MTEVVWTPDEETLARANVVRLMRRHGIESYWELVRRSQEEPEWFWPAASRTSASSSRGRGSRSTTTRAAPNGRPGSPARRSPSRGTASTAGPSATPTRIGAVFAGEDGSRRELTFAELSRDVTRLAEGLVRLGVEPGDRVAIYLPMCPEVAVASHACAHVGAVQVPLFSGFAAPAVEQRLRDSEAKVVITADYSLRRGARLPMRETVEEAVRRRRRSSTSSRGSGTRAGARSSRRAPASCRRSRSTASTRTCSRTRPARPAGRRASSTSRAASSSRSRARSPTRPTSTRRTSSTSPRTWAGSWARGPSWAAARSAARSSSRRGRPDRPPDRLWRLVEDERVSVLGLSPTLVRALIPHGEPEADLSRCESS